MINKQKKNEMKKSGAKVLCAIMIASTLMSTASPVLAAEDCEQQAVMEEVVMDVNQDAVCDGMIQAGNDVESADSGIDASAAEVTDANADVVDSGIDAGEADAVDVAVDATGDQADGEDGGTDAGVAEATDTSADVADDKADGAEADVVVDSSTDDDNECFHGFRGIISFAANLREDTGNENRVAEQRAEQNQQDQQSTGQSQQNRQNQQDQQSTGQSQQNRQNQQDQQSTEQSQQNQQGQQSTGQGQQDQQGQQNQQGENQGEKKDDKKDDDSTRQTIEAVGETAGQFVNKVLDGKYDNTDQAIADLSYMTLNTINETVIKEIPYVGKFMSTILKGQLGEKEEDGTEKRLNEVNTKLSEINQTIQQCTKDIIDDGTFKKQNDKVKEMNTIYGNLTQEYRRYREDFEEAMLNLTDEDRDESGMERAYDIFRTIYSSRSKDFMEDYIKYIDAVTTTGDQISSYCEYNPDIMTSFDKIVTHDKNGEFAVMEYAEEKRALIDSVQETGDYGYDMLNTVMAAQKVQYELKKEACVQAIFALRAQADTAAEEEKKMINKMIRELGYERNSAESKAKGIAEDLKLLNNRKECLDAYLKRANDMIEKDQKKMNDAERHTELTYANRDFKSEKINGVDTFVEISADKTKILYRDYYGNLLGTRDVATDYTKVDQYDVEPGKIYKIRNTCGAIHNNTPEEENVLVFSVQEAPGVIWGTNRTAYGCVVNEDGSEGELRIMTIGFWGEYSVYERKVGDLKVC